MQIHDILLGLVGLFYTLCCCRTLSLLKVSARTRSQQHMLFLFCSSGVADGVGGWRDYGVDPSQFSATLMRTCERLVKEGRFTPSNPVGILTSGYYELLQNKVPLLGTYAHRACTTCTVFITIHTNHDSESCFPCEQTYSGKINNIAAR